MATKTVAVVATVDPLHGIPSNIKVLCENIVKARGTERNNWADFAHYVGITQDVPVSVEFPTGKKPVGVSDARKKQCSAWFTAITMQSDVVFSFTDKTTGITTSAVHRDLKPGMPLFPKAVKEAQTHYSSCIQRALRTLGYMAPKPVSGAATASDNKASTVTTVSPANPLDGRMVSIASMLERLTQGATKLNAALVAFGTDVKLPNKKAIEAHDSIADDFAGLRKLIGELAALIVPEPVKSTLAGVNANLPPPVPGAVAPSTVQ